MDALKIKETATMAEEKALQLLDDREEVEKALKEAEEISFRFRNFEKAGERIDEMFALVRDYLAGQFSDCTKEDIAVIVGAALYLANEDDVIPDNVPVLGSMDDMVIIDSAYKKCENVIKKYKGE